MSQNERILQHLQTGAAITPLEALQLAGCLRLSERIRELEAQGIPINHIPVTIGKKHVMSYRLGGFAYG